MKQEPRKDLEKLVNHLPDRQGKQNYHWWFSNNGNELVFMCQGMQTVVRLIGYDNFEIIYEHALHQCTREQCNFQDSLWLLNALFDRSCLCKIPIINK